MGPVHGYGDVIERIGMTSDVSVRKGAKSALRESEAHQAFLLRLSDTLRPLTDPLEVQATVARMLGEYLGVNRVLYAEMVHGERVIIHREHVHFGPSMVGVYPWDRFIGEQRLRDYEAGKPFVVENMATDPRLGPERAAFEAIGVSACVGWALKRGGKWLAAMGVNSSTPRHWTEHEVALVQAVADRASSEIQRAHSEAALRSSEEKYRSLFESIAEGVALLEVVFDEADKAIDYRYLETNPAHEALTGLRRHDILGKRVREIVPDVEDALIEPVGRVARSGEPARFEAVERDRWFAFEVVRVGGEGSNTVVVVFNDITERKRRDASIELLRAVNDELLQVEGIDDTMHTLCKKIGAHLGATICAFSDVDEAKGTTEGRYVWHRPGVPFASGVYKISEYHSDDVQRLMRSGNPEIVHSLAAFPEAVQTRMAALRIGAYVNLPFVRDGVWRATLSVVDSNEREWREDELELLRELTFRIWTRLERVRAEQALRHSQERYRTLTELAPALLWEADPGGANVVSTTRHWREYTGQTPTDAPSGGWHDAIHPDDRTRSDQVLAGAYAAGKPLEIELRIRRYDGVYRWFLVRQLPLRNEAGHVTRWLGLAADVHAQRLALEEVERLVAERTSERDALRRQLLAAEEAERRRLARELHDQLGQQLTAFRLGLEDAARLAASNNQGASADGPLVARIGQLQTLTDAMMRGARYVALELRPPELDDVGLASAVETYVREWGDRYGVAAEATFIVPSTQPLFEQPEYADIASALYRIVQESLTNVAKHAKATAVSVVVDGRGGEARLIVEDNGLGFDVDALRGRSSREQRFGLAGIQERAALFGGEMTIESSPDAGTTLYVRLPLA